MYDKLNWLDEVKDQHGNVIQKGTPLSAKNMNHIEDGIHESNVAAAMLAQRSMQQNRVIEELEGEIGQIELTNSSDFPFNNSIETISMNKQRDTLNYRVTTEVMDADGTIGDIFITDKQLNGFKIMYTGSAKRATVKYYIQGGMYQ